MTRKDDQEQPPEYILVPKGTIFEWEMPPEYMEQKNRPPSPAAQAAIDAEHHEVIRAHFARKRARERRSRGE